MIYAITSIVYKIFNRDLKLSDRVKIDPRAFIARGGNVRIGKNSILRAGAILLPAGGHIHIGDNVSLNQYVVINGEGGVTIGDNVMIAAFSAFYSSNHVTLRKDIPMREQGMISKGGICIEDDVWIGAHSVILDGVKIGHGSVIAAGSVVSKCVDPFSIMAGVPAAKIGTR